ncbi:conserved Plasmodium protein, unknown function [Plasmodium vinckei vinckei]|uniref:RAP domain-containing protein n=1 Tax=Plasmodium vinckei vinckei TaxID=54757 RepID=A0A449BYB9_PLAVN|nr:conserved Plasmodium protein, unknown function [Plasmodium vinckei vinckei]VEV58433.1 conserved Plasmodium protein, unknown function [Plasmodium vinckei vinckei]
MNSFFRKCVRRSFTSLKMELGKFEKVSHNFIECIETYKSEKDISIKSYKNYKNEIKESINKLLNNDILNNYEKEDFKKLFTYSIILSRRILIQKDHAKDLVLSYISFIKNYNNLTSNDQDNIRKDEIDSKNDLLLLFKYIYYLNIDYDNIIYNYIYSELSNLISLYSLEELVECIKFISSFKNKKWTNQKMFSRCIDEIVNKFSNGSLNNSTICNTLTTIIKACSRLNYEITDIHILLDLFRDNYDKNNNKDMHMLIKIIYNLFISNYHNYKNTNQLIYLLKQEILQNNKQTEYPTYNKYQYNDNVIIDNNFDLSEENATNNLDARISYDNINNIHQLYMKEKEKSDIITPNISISSINLYRLKFIDILIRSDNYLFNTFYLPNSNFFDFVKNLKMEGKPIRDTIFIKQAQFFIKENGYKITPTHTSIYSIYALSGFKNTYIEFVHNISVNKKMKENLNKFHKHHLNYKLRNLKFLGWTPIILYEHEWKKLRNYNEKFEYIKKNFKSIHNHMQ